MVRYQEPYRRDPRAISNIRLLSPSGERVSLAQLTKMEVRDGAYDIYREGTAATSPSPSTSAAAI